MNHASSDTATLELGPGINWKNGIWVAAAFGVLIAAVEMPSLWFLNFVHVFSGALWTGIDLFMGFVIGPIMRRVDLSVRRAIIMRLMPKMLFLMPTLAIITGTAGPILAQRLGFFQIAFPAFGWVAAALAILTVLTIQGIGILLPVNLLVYFEMRKPAPDGARIQCWMRRYVRVVAIQGVLQVAIIVIMAHFATGI